MKSEFYYVYKHEKKIPSLTETCVSEERSIGKGNRNEERGREKNGGVRKGSIKYCKGYFDLFS